ncbi:ATPase [Thermanaerothrix daxensis]|uniref:ATPase n=1 Tax=Thermanaerothrix daxensis TaxID=869279 RepID=A0A0P6YL85_9CHLR|nr:HAD-IC family P-type ATPase [Thermanaerothrix daxensis]KPL83385.1 ATPase [Thermanaerothrix daxensis]
MSKDTVTSGIQFREPSGRVIPWHALDEKTLLRKLQTRLDGLTPGEAAERLREFGRNELPERKPPTLLQVFLHQFASPLIYILLVAGVIALLMQDYKDAVFIFAVVLINAVIGTVQEWQAEQSAHALQTMIKVRARARRAGHQLWIDSEEVVPGDVLVLESGDRVPADMRLLQVNNLTLDEAFLTGESQGVVKRAEPIPAETPLSERVNMAYAGSTVLTGRGLGVVVATGAYTEVGKIARVIKEEEGAKAPLVIRMERFARQISLIVLGFAGLLGVISFSRGEPLNEVFILVVAMAVSAIPEGLPVAMTVALSLATRRMAKRHVIVRKLAAVESLGSCTLIASDKTGTLTVNQQTVKEIVLPEGSEILISGQGYNDEGEARLRTGEPLSEAYAVRLRAMAVDAILCNEATFVREDGHWKYSGDSMDVALLALAAKLGLSNQDVRREHPKLAEIPFESEKRYSAVLYATPSGRRLVVKGAVETVLGFCERARSLEGEQPLAAEALAEMAMRKAREGYRVLALAGKDLGPGDAHALSEADLQGMVFEALLCFIDPLRPEAKEAVETAHRAGVKVVMITGDHPATALAIARELGIAETQEEVITGQELAEIGTPEVPEFYETIRHKTVFARVTPEQKLQIVDGFIRLGEFVAVTGDGVNDAPALKKANIGVAMGSGTDIAKDTATLIITDDNFASIVAGIEEGRYAYANVRKVTLLLISTGLAELVLLGTAIVLNLPLPLVAVQILWLNMVTNGIQDVALAFEGGEPGVMKQKPRDPKEGIFNRKMIELVLISGLTMALGCFVAWIWLIRQDVDIETKRALLLTLLVLMQFYHVLNCRSEEESAFRVPWRRNPVLAIGMVVALGLHVVATEVPLLQSLLRLSSIPLTQWLVMGVLASIVLWVVEVYKAIQRRRTAQA